MLLQIRANNLWVGDMSYVDADAVASIEGQHVHSPDESVESQQLQPNIDNYCVSKHNNVYKYTLLSKHLYL